MDDQFACGVVPRDRDGAATDLDAHIAELPFEPELVADGSYYLFAHALLHVFFFRDPEGHMIGLIGPARAAEPLDP